MMRGHTGLARIQLRLVTEETGFSDGDFIKELDHLFASGGGMGESIQILAESFHLQLLHAAATAIFEQAQLVVGLKIPAA